MNFVPSAKCFKPRPKWSRDQSQHTHILQAQGKHADSVKSEKICFNWTLSRSVLIGLSQALKSAISLKLLPTCTALQKTVQFTKERSTAAGSVMEKNAYCSDLFVMRTHANLWIPFRDERSLSSLRLVGTVATPNKNIQFSPAFEIQWNTILWSTVAYHPLVHVCQ